jgi:hypothetical protein
VNPPSGSSPYLRANSPGLAVPLLYPKADPAGMIPNLTFGGVPSGTALLSSTIGSTTAFSQWYGLQRGGAHRADDFYFRAFDGLVTRSAAGYHYGGNWASSTGGTFTR